MKSGTLVRDHTRAKNLTQQRLEQIRDLRFHVDRQNGPFLDLLDIYYTHALTGAAATSVSNGGTTLAGTYVSSGSAATGEPTAPYFRITTGPLPENNGFSQVVTSQFLRRAELWSLQRASRARPVAAPATTRRPRAGTSRLR